MPPSGAGVPTKHLSTTSLRDADGVEEMRAAIAVDDADAHLGHDLGQAEFEGVEQICFALFGIEIARSFKRKPGTDGARTHAEQDSDVMHVAAVAGFDGEADLGTDACAG